MKFSVIIPAYNAEKTVTMALDSVFAQSCPPFEVLVFDDGSTDATPDCLERFGSRIKVFRQKNQGVAHARNFLCAQAAGDMLAFLDADDLWHPNYLQVQKDLIEQFPQATAYFTYLETFNGYQKPEPKVFDQTHKSPGIIITAEDFLFLYDHEPMSFQMSGCCVGKSVLNKLGSSPFPQTISGADDTYFHMTLPLHGAMAHNQSKLVFYRVTPSSISADRLTMALKVNKVFEMLAVQYEGEASKPLKKIFPSIFASRRRNCGKFLMINGQVGQARAQFWLALQADFSIKSFFKAGALIALTYFPRLTPSTWQARFARQRPFVEV